MQLLLEPSSALDIVFQTILEILLIAKFSCPRHLRKKMEERCLMAEKNNKWGIGRIKQIIVEAAM